MKPFLATTFALAMVLTLRIEAPAAGLFGTLQGYLTAPDAGYMTRGLTLAGELFAPIIGCSICVRLGRLAWFNHGDIHGWQTELGELLWKIMVPAYVTLYAARVILPEIQPLINAVGNQITGMPGVADPDAIFLLGVSTAAEIFVGALHPITGGGGGIIPNFGLDVLWMTAINLGVACVAAFIVVLTLTWVAFEVVMAVAGGLFAISIGSVAIAFSASPVTDNIAHRYISSLFATIMRIVCMVAYGALVAEVFAAIPFAAGLLVAGTFIKTVLEICAVSVAVAAGAKRVVHLSDAAFSGSVFVTASQVGSEATAGPRAALSVVQKVASR